MWTQRIFCTVNAHTPVLMGLGYCCCHSRLPSISDRHGTDVQLCSSRRSLNSWRKRPLGRRKGQSSPQDAVCRDFPDWREENMLLLKGSTHSRRFLSQSSLLEMTVRTKRGSRTLQRSHLASFTSNNKPCCFNGSEKRGKRPSGPLGQ